MIAVISEAAACGHRLSVVGGGSKASIGSPVDARTLPLAGLAGIVDYDPSELVLVVRPGTPLHEVQALVARERQMLAFEPFDHGPMFGIAEGWATIGGVVAAGVAGSRRISAGGARDHLLGFRAVSGRGELFVAGAKVVKNVTGYDLPKLAAGSWGRLFAMTELTLKVLPRPETASTLAIAGLDVGTAVRAMAEAMGSQGEVAAAAHRPAGRGAAAVTALRIDGFAPSVIARGRLLEGLLAPFGSVEPLNEAVADSFWTDLRTLAPLAGDRALWRVNVPPSAGATLVEALSGEGADSLLDWAGGLIWIAYDGDAALVRREAARAGGHAMLLRAGPERSAGVPVFQPLAPGLAALEARIRRAFDPAGVFETGRF